MSDAQLPRMDLLSGLGTPAAGQLEENKEEQFDMDGAATYAVLEEAFGKGKASPEAIIHVGKLYALDPELLSIIENPNEYSKKEFNNAREKLIKMAKVKLKDQSSQIKGKATEEATPSLEEVTPEEQPIFG